MGAAFGSLRTFGSLGAGIDTMGLVLADILGSGAEYKWAAEGCPIAARAHTECWHTLGQYPVLWTEAENATLANRIHQVDVCAALMKRGH